MKEVYLDNSATTRAYPEVGDLVRKVLCEDYGNPSSMHRKGVEAEKYIKEAKETFAKLLKVQEKEIFFTSGGTESDNLALIGAAKAKSKSRESSDLHPELSIRRSLIRCVIWKRKGFVLHFFRWTALEESVWMH